MKKVATLCTEVHSLTKSHIPSILLEISLFAQPMPPHRLMYLDLYTKKEPVLEFGTKRVRDDVLQDLVFPYDQDLK